MRVFINSIEKRFWQWPDGLIWKITEKSTLESRREKYRLFMSYIQPKAEHSILDVGVSPYFGRGTNFLELWYPYLENVTCLTNEDESKFDDFKRRFPQVKLVFGDGKQLPFDDDTFDIVFSNAVVEHVGGYQEQKRFINELVRVGKKFFVTTPNYYFPLDSHTLIPLAHYLPLRPRFWIYGKLGRGYYADLFHLNLLTPERFLSLFPKEIEVRITKRKFLGIPHSLIAVARKPCQESRRKRLQCL